MTLNSSEINAVLRIACNELMISPNLLATNSQRKQVVLCREIITFYLYNRGVSFVEIGNILNKSRSTATRYYKSLNKALEDDKLSSLRVFKILNKLSGSS